MVCAGGLPSTPDDAVPIAERSAAQLTTAAKSVPAVPAGTDYHAVDYAGAVDSVNT